MSSLLTSNCLGVASSAKDSTYIISETDNTCDFFDDNELRQIVSAITLGGFVPITLDDGRKFDIRSEEGGNVSFNWKNKNGDQTATFNRFGFLNILDPDLVRTITREIKKSNGHRIVPPSTP